jgi:uncharacterized protein Yka (UPF0111/DUF47 family)
MFSLQRALGKDDQFYDLMEGSAEEGRASILCLVRLLKSPAPSRALDPFAEIRRQEKRLTQQLTEHLCATFVTPMEREDIEALANVLYKIPKTVEKFGERLVLAPQHLEGLDLSQQIQMLEQAADEVVAMVKELRQDATLSSVKTHNDVLQRIEGEADKLMLECIHRLYTGDHNPLRVVIQKDLYELLEKVFDRCRDLGKVVFRIVLKYS